MKTSTSFFISALYATVAWLFVGGSKFLDQPLSSSEKSLHLSDFTEVSPLMAIVLYVGVCILSTFHVLIPLWISSLFLSKRLVAMLFASGAWTVFFSCATLGDHLPNNWLYFALFATVAILINTTQAALCFRLLLSANDEK